MDPGGGALTRKMAGTGDLLSGGGLRFRDEAAAAQPVPLLAEGILPGALEAGERTVDPETLPIFLLAQKGVVLLPDTPELRAKLREALGQDVPEFPQVCMARAE